MSEAGTMAVGRLDNCSLERRLSFSLGVPETNTQRKTSAKVSKWSSLLQVSSTSVKTIFSRILRVVLLNRGVLSRGSAEL